MLLLGGATYACCLRLITQIIRLCANFPGNRIKSIRMDNAGEFTSKAFNDYCLALSINVEHSVPHVHTQNDLPSPS
jgi:hypothetical protein